MAATTKVLVTGGSGYLGSWCVKQCLDRGYTVHTTVRSAEKAAFLKSLPGADVRLKVFDGIDLMAPGAFDAPVEGCQTVLHTASPFFMEGGTEEKLVTPALEGTRTVLQSCTKAGVKTVVLTSSIAAMNGPPGTAFSAENWTDEAKSRAANNWYGLSKTLAEKLAWEMSKEEGCPWRLATMNPCVILGPMLPGQASLNTSSALLVELFDGTYKQCPDNCLSLVDVRDVAAAHVLAIDNEVAMGKRFLLVADCPRMIELANMLRDVLPKDMAAKVPTEVKPSDPPGQPSQVDCSPAKDILGMKFKLAAEMVPDTITQLLENGFTRASQNEHKARPAGNCDVAVLGLSTMGSNLALNIADKGFQVAVYNRTTATTHKFMKENATYKNITACETYDDLKAALKKPRRALILVQAGAATDATIEQLCQSFEKEDIIIDCGNAQFRDQTRRAEELEAKGLRFLGMGISGGEEGARKGPAFFPGGTLSVWEDIKDVIEAAAAKASDGRPCAVMNGKGGAGSCVKMFHNAAEYAILQIWGEVYAILREWGAPSAKMADVLSSWKRKEGMGHKGLLSSYMLDITVEVVKMADTEAAGGKSGGSLLVEKALDWVGSKGTGLWSVQEALEAGVPAPSLAEAVICRQVTLAKEQRKAISKTVKLPSGTSYTDDDVEDLYWAAALALISSYAQMFDCLRVLDQKFGFGLNLAATTSTFRAGCILQGYLLEPMTKAFEKDPNLPNLLCGFKAEIETNLPRYKRVMAKVVSEGSTAVPVCLASLSYIQMMATETLPAGQCVALQRDVFGRHGFKRVDKEGDFNAQWPELQ